MATERRRYVRYRVRDKSFAALGRDYTKVGKILNIGMGGVAFEYIAGPQHAPGDSFVNLFTTETSFHINDIPCKVVHDDEVRAPNSRGQRASMLITRRCGVCFHSVSESQIKELQNFIRMNSVGACQNARGAEGEVC